MMNFGRRDRIAEAKIVDKSGLKPALYEPPGSAPKATAANASTRPASMPAAPPHQNPPGWVPASLPLDVAPPVATPVATPAATPAHQAEPPVSKLFVGANIKLRGVEISDCDVLVIEGHVEATVHSKAMEIARPGTLKGTALIDVAEIHGEFSGELTARTRLVVHGSGRVSGTIRYGKLIVEEGGELNGDVKRLNDGDEPALASRVGSSAANAVPELSNIVSPH
jgi:cytoskeletal protein CcmA (bactofilin family)